jgi:hypothetical protein
VTPTPALQSGIAPVVGRAVGQVALQSHWKYTERVGKPPQTATARVPRTWAGATPVLADFIRPNLSGTRASSPGGRSRPRCSKTSG